MWATPVVGAFREAGVEPPHKKSMIAADTTGMRSSRPTFAPRITTQWDLVALGVLTVLAVVIRRARNRDDEPVAR